MSQTLLIEDDEERKNILSINLNIFLGTDMVLKNHLDDALKLLRVHPSVNLLILSLSPLQSESSISESLSVLGKSIEEHPVYAKKLRDESFAIIILTSISHMEEKPLQYLLTKYAAFHFFDHQVDLKILLQKAASLLSVRAEDVLQQPLPPYIPIPLSAFLYLQMAICDVYLKVKKVVENDHYVKRFLTGDQISPEVINRYISFGEQFLYIQAEERVKFAKIYTEQLNLKRGQATLALGQNQQQQQQPLEQQLIYDEEVVHYAMQVVSACLDKLGQREEFQLLTKTCVQSLLKTIKDSQTALPLIKKLFEQKNTFIYQHSSMILFFCQFLLKRVHWGSEELLQKLGFVAFFHDILLTKEKLIGVRSEEDLWRVTLSDDEKSLVLKHAQLTAEMIKKFPQAPMDIDLIIKQHHGSQNGIGFPANFQQINILPSSMVFLLAEELSYHLVKACLQFSGEENFKLQEFQFPAEDIFKKMREKYTHPKYQQLIDILQEIPL